MMIIGAPLEHHGPVTPDSIPMKLEYVSFKSFSFSKKYQNLFYSVKILSEIARGRKAEKFGSYMQFSDNDK